jgi:hypothetical protein
MCELTHTRRNFGCPNGGLPVMPDTVTNPDRVEITPLGARYRLPAAYPFRFFTELASRCRTETTRPIFLARRRLRRSYPQGWEAK